MLGSSFPCCVATCVFLVLVPAVVAWLVLWTAGGDASPWVFLPLLATTCCAVGFFLKTTLTDPGVMPKREPGPRYPATPPSPGGKQRECPQSEPYTDEFLGSDDAQTVKDDTADALKETKKPASWRAECENAISREFAPQEPCPTCRTARPPGTAHCHDCGHCVVFLDHHCPWLGTCIGMRNYWWFLCALGAGTAHGAACAGYAVWGAVLAASAYQESSGGDASPGPVLTAAGLAICALAGLFCAVFSLFMLGTHVGLLLRDETTRASLQARPAARTVLAKTGETLETERTPGQRTQLVRRLAAEDPVLRGLDLRPCPGQSFGLRRALLGRKMPLLRGMRPEEAELIAWRWTVVLSGFGAE